MKPKKSACSAFSEPQASRPSGRGTSPVGGQGKIAFTLVELLIVIGIIALLIALLIPALSAVRNMTRETQQKAQLTTIEMALTAFKNDYGAYPPSHGNNYTTDPPSADYEYFGAQTLTEALVGWDQMGFHPKSAWRKDGEDKDDGDTAYTGATTGTSAERENNLKERKGPYLEIATAGVFRLGCSAANVEDGLYGYDVVPGIFERNTYVICDVFTVRKVTIGSGSAAKNVRAGTPILYYRANTASKKFDPNAPASPDMQATHIYNAYDNFSFIDNFQSVTVDGSSGKPHLLGGEAKNLFKPDFGDENHIYGIKDSKVTIPWPHRPDSYILISAGADGLYGTRDDIRNF